MRKCVIVASLLLLSVPAWGQSYDNSQGEGNYNGSNSQGAATYYNGGGKDTYGDGANYAPTATTPVIAEKTMS